MTQVDSRKYVGARFGFSISVPAEGDPAWPASYGDPEPVVNEFVFTEGCSVLFEGGYLALGHRWSDPRGDWNQRGLLNHLLMKSRDFRGFRPAPPDPVSGTPSPAIINLLAWPDAPPPAGDDLPNRLVAERVLEIRQVRPAGFDAAFLDQANAPDAARALLATPLGQYARIRALTTMRRELVQLTDFRLCIGGAPGKPERRLPDVIEEALLTAQAGKPLYVSSAFGGVSKALADCLLQRRIKLDTDSVFFTPAPIAQLMNDQSAAHPYAEGEGPSVRDGWNALTTFEGLSLAQLAAQAGLSTEQYIDLLATPNIERAMAWVMSGVSRLLAKARGV